MTKLLVDDVLARLERYMLFKLTTRTILRATRFVFRDAASRGPYIELTDDLHNEY